MPSRATLSTPPLPDSLGPELGGLAGEFAYFDMPKLSVGLGTSSKHFTTEFVVLNKTILVGWAFQALIAGEATLVVKGNPEISVLDIDPITYHLDLKKQLKCKPVSDSEHASNRSATQLPVLRAMDQPDIIAPISITCSYDGLPRDSVVV